MLLHSYAQRGEDLVLFAALANVRCGYYIDVGAHDSVLHSVTKLFYDRGWSGINVEPIEKYHETLVRDRPRDVNLLVAAGEWSGEIILHEFFDSSLSTVLDHCAERHRQSGLKGCSRIVPVRRLDEICAEYARGEIHFLKIDVEGAESQVLKGGNWSRYRPWIVVIEAFEPLSNVPTYMASEEILFKAGYEFAASDSLNRYYVPRDRRALKPVLKCAAAGSIAKVKMQDFALRLRLLYRSCVGFKQVSNSLTKGKQ